MLQFTNKEGFLKVDTFQYNAEGSVDWTWNEGDVTHSGVIFEGLTRVVTNLVETTNEEGEPEAVLDVWEWLHELSEAGELVIEPYIDTTTYEQKLLEAINLRKQAYILESDPIYMEAKYDEDEILMQKWRDKVEEIKLRIPLPVE